MVAEKRLLRLQENRRRHRHRPSPALRRSILVTSNLPFDEWTEIFGSERTGALDRLTHHVHILAMNGDVSTAMAEIPKNTCLTAGQWLTRQEPPTLPPA